MSLSWPVWGIILRYANRWCLNRVCKKFQFYVEKTHRFYYKDIKAIVAKGSARVLLCYFEQFGDTWKSCFDLCEFEFRDFAMVDCFIEKKYYSVENIIQNSCKKSDLKLFKHVIAHHEFSTLSLVGLAYAHGTSEIIEIAKNYLDEETSVEAIRWAAKRGLVNEFKELIQLTDQVDFHDVCTGGNLEIINICKDRGLGNGLVGIEGAFISNNIEAVKLFEPFDHDGILSICFRLACARKSINVVKYILNTTGYEPGRADMTGATWSGDVDILNLVYRDTFMNFDFELQMTCTLDCFDAFKFYVQKGAIPKIAHLLIACRYNRVEIFKYMVDELKMEVTPDVIKTLCDSHSYHICEYLKPAGYVCTNCVGLKYKCPISGTEKK